MGASAFFFMAEVFFFWLFFFCWGGMGFWAFRQSSWVSWADFPGLICLLMRPDCFRDFSHFLDPQKDPPKKGEGGVLELATQANASQAKAHDPIFGH